MTSVVNNITADQWLYGQKAEGGAVAFGTGSQYLEAYQDQPGTQVPWLLTIGCNGNQTFGGGPCTDKGTPELYVGPGDY